MGLEGSGKQYICIHRHESETNENGVYRQKKGTNLALKRVCYGLENIFVAPSPQIEIEIGRLRQKSNEFYQTRGCRILTMESDVHTIIRVTYLGWDV